MVDALSPSFRKSTMPVDVATPLAPLPGRCPTTDGRDVSKPEPVVNELVKSVSALPDRSCTALVATMVTTLEAGSVPPFSTTVRLSDEIEATLPKRVPFANSANVLLLTVVELSDSEKVRTIEAFRPTPVMPSPGVTLTTVGGVVSAAAVVRNQVVE